MNFFIGELVAKRLTLLHELVPKAVCVAVLLNPADATCTETNLRPVQETARVIGPHLFSGESGCNEID